TKLKSGKGLNTQMKGTVEAVCQAKGCWMSLKSASDPSKLILVKFKDYAFFMPKDIAGKTVVVQGSAYKEVTSIEELKHYAEDEGKSKKEIDAIKSPKEEYKFMAEGVIIL
ncbi:MAG: DUF4920 domain-containing protein, partial [Saprospiraceae bacterium]|nr:DUF4920 domain-containing protein [Saprospiraceae bacterium]